MAAEAPRSTSPTSSAPAAADETVRAAVQRGLRILARRPRTETDLRARLAVDHSPAAVEAALARLRELGYVDDLAWAATYIAQRRATGRASRLLALELERHGIAADVAQAALEAHDDDAAAARVAADALRRLDRATRPLDAAARRRTLYGQLSRRGFRHAAIERALARVLTDTA